MSDDELFLIEGYKENRPRSSDSPDEPFWPEKVTLRSVKWQVPVYKLTRRFAESMRPRSILDVGCGTGFKLAKYLGDMAEHVTGVDQGSGIRIARSQFPNISWIDGDLTDQAVWEELRILAPDLIICSDVIEHIERPKQLLLDIRAVMSVRSTLVLSTPDRDVLERARPLGPPYNPRHIREWSMPEMTRLLASTGYSIIESAHLLPRQYEVSVRETARILYRLITLKVIPDRRSSMAFVLNRLD